MEPHVTWINGWISLSQCHVILPLGPGIRCFAPKKIYGLMVDYDFPFMDVYHVFLPPVSDFFIQCLKLSWLIFHP